MRLVATSSVAPGIALARDIVVAPSAGPLLRAGVTLHDALRDSLLANGVTRIWIDDDLGEGIAPTRLLGDRLRGEALAALGELHVEARQALARGRRLDPRTIDTLGGLAERIADAVLATRSDDLDLLDLAPAPAYLLHHAIDSSALAVLLAARHMTTAGWRHGTGPLRHDAPRSELARLGLGMLLCDLGMLTLPRAVLEDASPLDAEHWEQIHLHPVTGADLLGTTTSFVLKGIVRGHHVRWSGQGYPDGAAGEAIQPFARIAAVADAYDAMTSERHHRPALSPADAWAAIDAGAGVAFDPGVVAAFRDVVPRHPSGTELTLADGRSGVVAGAGPEGLRVRVREGDRIEELTVVPREAA